MSQEVSLLDSSTCVFLLLKSEKLKMVLKVALKGSSVVVSPFQIQEMLPSVYPCLVSILAVSDLLWLNVLSLKYIQNIC